MEVTNIPNLAYFVKHPMAEEAEFSQEVLSLLRNTLKGLFSARKVYKKWVFGSKRNETDGSSNAAKSNIQL